MCTSRGTFDRHCDLMLFDYKTTNRTDFLGGEIPPVQEPEIKVHPKVSSIKPKEFCLKDIHTVNAYKNPNFPFDLLAVPKEIIRTNCRDIQKPYEKPVDTDLEAVRKTRPRVLMVTGISIDDIKDEKKRQVVIEDTYTTTYEKASKYLEGRYDNTPYTAPLGNTTKTNPLELPRLKDQPYVHPEFRWRSVKWEREQRRGFVDPTVDFWKRRLRNRKH